MLNPVGAPGAEACGEQGASPCAIREPLLWVGAGEGVKKTADDMHATCIPSGRGKGPPSLSWNLLEHTCGGNSWVARGPPSL